MKSFVILTLLAAFVAGAVRADTLRFAGVLGNSGEQGASLVRFAPKTAVGLGVVHDRRGSLWDRAGTGVLNRYALDGRLLATYPIAPTGGRTERDKLVVIGDTVLLKLGKKIYTLPADAPSGTAPTPLPVEATRLSFNVRDGWAAAALDKTVFLVNLAGEKRDVAVLETVVDEIDIGPDGGVYVQSAGKLWRVDPEAPADRRGPWASIGERAQWLDGHWYAHAWHGTTRRFAADFSPDPGVVLGGASGSFIGYVEGNTDIENSPGLARIGRGLFAVSGNRGTLHLLSWSETEKRFSIVRRIGALPKLESLAIDAKGRVWSDGGVWLENSGPGTPLRHCVPALEEGATFGSTILPNGSVVTAGLRWGKPAVYYGPLDGPARMASGVDALKKTMVTSTVVTIDKRTTLVVVDASGRGVGYVIDANGKPSGEPTDVVLQATTPLKAVTSLASVSPGTLVVAADGQLVEFAWKDKGWRETARWSQWGEGADARFGSKVFVTTAANRLWVSDTARHRVLGFDPAAKRLLASFGRVDVSGDTVGALNSPSLVAVSGDRLAVYDAGNQRILRLDLVAD
ncbi:MAG: hypothetical protein ABW223_08740 [Rariglobus sp.]